MNSKAGAVAFALLATILCQPTCAQQTNVDRAKRECVAALHTIKAAAELTRKASEAASSHDTPGFVCSRVRTYIARIKNSIRKNEIARRRCTILPAEFEAKFATSLRGRRDELATATEVDRLYCGGR